VTRAGRSRRFGEAGFSARKSSRAINRITTSSPRDGRRLTAAPPSQRYRDIEKVDAATFTEMRRDEQVVLLTRYLKRPRGRADHGQADGR
jgi:hypothetical protein